MAALVETIIEYFEQSEQGAALRELLPVGSMVAEFDLSGVEPPYCVLLEGETVPGAMGFEGSFRIDETPVVFEVVATTRAQCLAIIEALDDLYQPAQLDGTNAFPLFVSKEPVLRHGDSLDRWVCRIAYKFPSQKSFG
jgi:hypothetical protein